MEADRKAISVSGFIVRSLEPAKSKHQMSVREHSGVLSTPAHPHLLPKTTQNITVGSTEHAGNSRAGGLFCGDREGLPQKLGTGGPEDRKQAPQPSQTPGPRTLQASDD